MQQSDVYYQLLSQHVSGIIMPIFRRSKTVCYCMWCTALVLLDVVGSGCGALRCRMRAVWMFLFNSLLLTSVSTCFGHHYAHLQENKGPVTAFGVLFWFCWMWLVQDSAPQPLTSICCILLVFSLHILLTMHGHRNLNLCVCTYQQNRIESRPVQSESLVNGGAHWPSRVQSSPRESQWDFSTLEQCTSTELYSDGEF